MEKQLKDKSKTLSDIKAIRQVDPNIADLYWYSDWIRVDDVLQILSGNESK
jgi:hypothetical protein